MKAYEETIRKYYKYIPFVQPLLTANGTMGGNAFACNQSAYHTEGSGTKREAWQAFDSDTSDTRWQVNDINLNSWYNIEWYNPEALYITSLHIRNSGDLGDYTVKEYVLYGSDNGSNWIELTSGTNNNVTSNNEWIIIVNLIEAYKYFRLSCKGRVTKSVMIRNISIDAYTGIEESTSSDYDYYKDINEYKIVSAVTEHDVSTKTFRARASLQEWTVPTGVTKLHVDCVASKGRNGKAVGGKGGRVQCDLTVTAGQTLYIVVGHIPPENSSYYNASDIRTNNSGITNTTSLNSRLIVAGGGGSGGDADRNYFSNGGNGGGLTGEQGVGGRNASGGRGGTQTAGGAGSSGGSNAGGSSGQLGLGGNGGNGGGVGGAGYYGGGGGGCDGHNAQYWRSGGGGGSSYTDSTLCSNVVHTQGYNNDEGYITITANGSWKEYTTDYKAFKE